MKIRYNTKFEIGDTVYIAETYYGEYYVSEPFTVQRIEINVDKFGLYAEYTLRDKGQGSQYLWDIKIEEKRCFSDREECRLWCAIHNKI